MTINLQKGQRISLKKEAPGLTRVMCGLGWDVIDKQGGFLNLFQVKPDMDIDASVFCLDVNDQLRHTADFVYYRNLRHNSGAIVHQGDNLTGEGEGDDEQIMVDLPRIPDEIYKLLFVVNIYNCQPRKQEFGQVENAFVRLVDLTSDREIARYNLSGAEYRDKTGLIVAEVFRHENDEWYMSAVGEGISIVELKELIDRYSR